MSRLGTMFFVLVALAILALAAMAYAFVTHYGSQAHCDVTAKSVVRSSGQLCDESGQK